MLTRDKINIIRNAIRDGGTRYLPDLCNQASLAIDLQAEVDSIKEKLAQIKVLCDGWNSDNHTSICYFIDLIVAILDRSIK